MQFGIQLRCIGICREPTLSCVSRQDQTGRSKRGKPRKDLDELQKNNVLSVCFCPCSKCGFLFSGCCSKCMVLTCSKCRVWNFGKKICSKWLSATIYLLRSREIWSYRPARRKSIERAAQEWSTAKCRGLESGVLGHDIGCLNVYQMCLDIFQALSLQGQESYLTRNRDQMLLPKSSCKIDPGHLLAPSTLLPLLAKLQK